MFITVMVWHKTLPLDMSKNNNHCLGMLIMYSFEHALYNRDYGGGGGSEEVDRASNSTSKCLEFDFHCLIMYKDYRS